MLTGPMLTARCLWHQPDISHSVPTDFPLTGFDLKQKSSPSPEVHAVIAPDLTADVVNGIAKEIADME